MHPGTYSVHRVPRVLSELSSTRTEPSSREGEKDQDRNTAPVGRQPDHSQKAVPTSGKIASSNQGSTSGPSVLPQVTTGTAENVRADRSGLLCPTYPLHRGAGRAAMVVRSPVCLERQDHHDRETLSGDRIRCLNSRLGSILRRDTNRGPLVSRGETVACQLPGSSSSLPCSKMLCQRQEEHYSPTQNGQHHSSDVCEQAGRNSVPQVEHHSQGTMALVHELGYYPDCGAFIGSPQYNCRPRIPNNEGQIRWDVESQDLQQDPVKMGSTGSGHVCIQTDNSVEEVLQLEARSRGRSSGCLQSELRQPTGEGLCQPSLEPSRQSAEQSTTTAGHTRGVARGGFRGFRKPPLESVILIVTYHSDSAIRSH